MERLKLLATKPAAKIIAWLQANPGTSLPWAPATSAHANLMLKAGWLKAEKTGKEKKWWLTMEFFEVVAVLEKLGK